MRKKGFLFIVQSIQYLTGVEIIALGKQIFSNTIVDLNFKAKS